MRDYAVMLTTLMSGYLWGPAVASHLEAIKHLRGELPAVQVNHVQMYGHPQMLEDGHNIVTHKYIEAQKVFLQDRRYQAFIAIEDDMIIPQDALVRLLNILWSEDKPAAAYGLYVFRHGNLNWSAYTKLDARSGTPINLDEEQAKRVFGKVIDVAGVGLGCTAISREAMEKIQFQRRGPACNDWYFSIDAQKHGMVQRCDLGLVCGHMTNKPSPRILWPDPDAKNMVRIEFL